MLLDANVMSGCGVKFIDAHRAKEGMAAMSQSL